MKAPLQVEYRAMQALEALADGRPLPAGEFICEAFPKWPGPPQKAARILAAFANAARGRDVLWLIGAAPTSQAVNTNAAGRIRGADIARLDAWLGAVLPRFAGHVPGVEAFPIHADSSGRYRHNPLPVIALLIETGRVPFVIRNSGKAGTLEVPWWDAAAGHVRSAGRQELIKLLVPLQDLPQLEVLDAELTFYRNSHAGSASKPAYRWTLDGSLYVVPSSAESRTVIPLHRCRGGIHIPESEFRATAHDFNLSADKQSPSVRITESAALIEGLGRVFVYCAGSTMSGDIPWRSPLTATFDLPPSGTDRAAVAVGVLNPVSTSEPNQVGRWKL